MSFVEEAADTMERVALCLRDGCPVKAENLDAAG